MYSNRKLKHLLLWSMLAGNLAVIHAQDRNIQCKVRDAVTGEVLGNVTINVKGSKQSLQFPC
ncbi:hypothetical protein ABE545_09470 [Sphingobacterium faecium]|uniref:hypothetical protein n=1 Tax=Sphingobacterium faecium TaxID=34087 RepID=UPI003208CC07